MRNAERTFWLKRTIRRIGLVPVSVPDHGVDLATVNSEVPQGMIVKLSKQQRGLPLGTPLMQAGPQACERRTDRGGPMRGLCSREQLMGLKRTLGTRLLVRKHRQLPVKSVRAS